MCFCACAFGWGCSAHALLLESETADQPLLATNLLSYLNHLYAGHARGQG